jgi:hypothetical protein
MHLAMQEPLTNYLQLIEFENWNFEVWPQRVQPHRPVESWTAGSPIRSRSSLHG